MPRSRGHRSRTFSSKPEEFTPLPSFRRLAKVAGIKNIGEDSLQQVAKYYVQVLKDILKIVTTLVEYEHKKTVTEEHIIQALQLSNIKYYSTGESSCKPCKKYSRGKRSSSLTEIKFYQKNYQECCHIPSSVFNRTVRTVIQEYKNSLRFTSEAITSLHYAIESILIQFLQKTNLVAIHASRETVKEKDIELVKELVKQ